jgi:antibiotic biosynthesis monooxygenase (ABM) superfamily enzyme
MNITNDNLANDLDKTAIVFSALIRKRLKPGHENEFDYWQACFDAARQHPDAAFLQTKAENALCELIPHLN